VAHEVSVESHPFRVAIFCGGVAVLLAGCATFQSPSPSVSLADVANRNVVHPGDRVRLATSAGERIEGAFVAIGHDAVADERTVTIALAGGMVELRESVVRDIWRRRSRSESARNGAVVLGLFGAGMSTYVAFVTGSDCTEEARSRGQACLRYRDIPAATLGWAAIGAGIGASWRSSMHVFTADPKGATVAKPE
jgi:hypothetical protein